VTLENQNSPDSEQNASHQSAETTAQVAQTATEFQSPPSKPQCKNGYKQSKHWLEYVTFGLELVGFIVLCVYAGYTIKIYCANKQAANAATSAANTAKESLRLDQRAWVFARGFLLSAEPQPNQPITVTLYLVNSGKTPALNVISKAHPSNWNQQPPERDWSVFEGRESHGLLPPGVSSLSIKTAPLTLTNGLADYNSGINSIYVQAKITYLDSFAIPHWTTVCVLHHHGRPLNEFDFCEIGNSVDEEKH
jgi:hypothetical protein